jgi:hypothetical protein
MLRRSRTLLAVAGVVFTAVVLAFAEPALAGSPHFVDDTVTVTKSGNTLTVSGKEAGLGDEDQVHITVEATASCINPGNNKPQAANKETFSAEGDFPVQNGKANFSLTLTATFDPSCSPPMTVQWTDITVTDVTNGISLFFADP